MNSQQHQVETSLHYEIYMFSFFSSSSKTKVDDKPFSAYLGGAHFASLSIADEPKLGQTVNLKGVAYIKGEQDIAVTQNQAVMGSQNELQIDRASGQVSDKIERRCFLQSLSPKENGPRDC